MKIKGETIVEIGESERMRIARESFYTALKKCGYDWSCSHFIRDAKVYVTQTYTSSHTWSTDEFKRDATETDLFIVELLKSL
jgi:hypothetical protein